jgi:uncharacterized protein YwgA
MKADNETRLRLAVLSTLVNRAPQKLGRTALMKFAYLLQTVRGVPLGYQFELYNYGPYDNTVLGDLSHAVTLQAMKSQTVYYPGGYGYEYSAKEGHAALCAPVAEDLDKFDEDINWVLARYGKESASRLELVSTIVFAEREMRRKRQDRSRTELARRVKRIKPHFSEGTITQVIDELADDELIAITHK